MFEARGEILTVPAEKGDIRNLTRTPGVVERDPAWSPDGKWIAYFSDESGEYALHIREQGGQGEVKKIALGNPPSFFYNPLWSPDSKKIAYTDKRLNLWYLDVEKGDAGQGGHDLTSTRASASIRRWSPDSRWLAYAKQLQSHMHAVFVYSLEDAKATQVTDGLSDARFPAFDKGGKYLYFTASTDVGPDAGLARHDAAWTGRSPAASTWWCCGRTSRRRSPPRATRRSSRNRRSRRTRRAKTAEAKEPAAGGEKPKEPDKEKAKEPEKVAIDFEGIGQRILALPIPAQNYTALAAGKEGMVYLLEGAPVTPALGGPAQTLHKFDLSKRKIDKFADGVNGFVVSANGEKILLNMGPQWIIAAAAGPFEPGKGVLKTGEMEVYVEPADRVEADVPRGLADRARLLLRPQPPRPRPDGGREEVRAVPGGRRQPRRT